MYRPNRHTASLFLTATLAISVVTVACSPAPTVTVNEPEHHWDDHENQAWHRYLAENHRQDHEFNKSEKNEQSEYWTWRRNHPD